jgi:hypothetical protein
MGDRCKYINIKIVSDIIHNYHKDNLVAGNREHSTDYIFGFGTYTYLPFCGDLRIFMIS